MTRSGPGGPIAFSLPMKGVWRFQDLIAWQLADQLRQVTIPFCEKVETRRDYKLKGQLSDAASSAPKNIAEGFGRKNAPGVRAVLLHRPRLRAGGS